MSCCNALLRSSSIRLVVLKACSDETVETEIEKIFIASRVRIGQVNGNCLRASNSKASFGSRAMSCLVKSRWPSKAKMCKGVSVKVVSEILLRINGSFHPSIDAS
ncbi:hypothetical protein L484_013456 [Morus notabilis]|uniref:Uncharacterized protein n=1 Tax=Morus notabilis TaxID=981085 RepID=W9QZD2_9ROSA|nr:hypothetical protein L484_013456 [Morus notabilis]